MTSPIHFPCHVIGLMSGTSADGIDAAILYTDGQNLVEPGPSLSIPYPDALRRDILNLMQGKGDEPAVAQALTELHITAVETLRAQACVQVSLIGFHGQTIYHAPEKGITVQIGDAAGMARATGIPVIAQFRTRDVAEGGQGAPLVPLYHAALAHAVPKPLMVVNIGGVSNYTWIGRDGGILAADCGPGNALMDDWMHQHTGQRYDEGGACAARGTVDAARIAAFLDDPFFRQPAPKSLDRHHFSLKHVEGMGLEDGIATLTAMTAHAIVAAFALVPEMPQEMLITGGGRYNATLMQFLRDYGSAALGKPLTVRSVSDIGWDGDMLEAQAFAYLAARSVLGLPLSLPSTTGVRAPVTGGVFFPA